MSLRVEWSNRSLKDMERLMPRVQQRISEAVGRFAATGSGDTEKVRGSRDLYRQRIGDWRVFFRWIPGEDTIHIRRVRHRREAYKEFSSLRRNRRKR